LPLKRPPSVPNRPPPSSNQTPQPWNRRPLALIQPPTLLVEHSWCWIDLQRHWFGLCLSYSARDEVNGGKETKCLGW
jgi:hypothetical protein